MPSLSTITRAAIAASTVLGAVALPMVAHAQTVFTFAGGGFTSAGAQPGGYIFQGKDDRTAGQTSLGANSTAALTSYQSIVGVSGASESVINFEGFAAGSYANGTDFEPGSGITGISGTNMLGNVVTIDDGTIGGTVALGYNTTAGGSKYLYAEAASKKAPGSITFTFTPGVTGFGANFLGVGTGTGSLTYNDGTVVAFNLSNSVGGSPSAVGASGFFGLLDFNRTIASVTVNIGTQGNGFEDIFGIDDLLVVRNGNPTTVVNPAPEPGAIVTGLSMVGMTGLGLVRGRRRKAA